MACLPNAMVGSRTGKSIYSHNTFWGQLEKSECELYVSSVARLDYLTVTVAMWVGTGSLNLSTVGILGQIILCGRGRPVHCSTFSSIPGLYPADSSSTLSSLDYRKYLQTL